MVADVSEDRLNFEPLVRALVRFLDNRGTKPPVVLAINGPWGSGKSSLMSMLSTELEKTGRFRIAWFNAWQYQKQEQILAAFLKSVAGELSKVWGPWLSLRLAWARFRRADFTDLILIFLPIFLIVLALAVPEIADRLADPKDGKTPPPSLAGGLEAILYVLGGGGLLAQARKILPFQFSLKWLFAGSDLSGKLGFLDEFQSEFRLYREAVGRDKFLIIIDDLDRCNPDAVVEVLKTVNLIVNGDTGPGKTFFILGFDERYIIQSIEQDFKDFAKLDERGAGSFGRDYLKKIVTVSLSVPVPDPNLLKDLARVLGEGPHPDKQKKPGRPKGLKALATWLTRLQGLFYRPLPLVVLLFLAVGAFIWFDRGDVEKREQVVETGPAQTAAVTSVETDPTGSQPASGVISAALPAPNAGAEEASAGRMGWLEWLGLALVAAAVLGYAAAVRRQRLAPPEPLDAREFTEALEAVEDHLPKNPRDLVRLVNRMRVDYLVQDMGPDGEPLTAEQSVAMTLLHMRYAKQLDPAKLESWLLPSLQSNGQAKTLEELPDEDGERGEWVRDLRAISADVPQAVTVLSDVGMLKHYLSVQGHFSPLADGEADTLIDGEGEGAKVPQPADEPADHAHAPRPP